MWLKNSFASLVDEVAHVFYVNRDRCEAWNKHRKGDEPMLLTGWVWSEKGGSGREQHGIKTITACYIDAYYALVLHHAPPKVSRPRIVADNVRKRRAA
jgi:hypothetical protein